MKLDYEQVKAYALALSEDDRLRLRYELDHVSAQEDDSVELSPAWRSVIERRLAEFRSGKVKGIPADEVMANARRILDEE